MVDAGDGEGRPGSSSGGDLAAPLAEAPQRSPPCTRLQQVALEETVEERARLSGSTPATPLVPADPRALQSIHGLEKGAVVGDGPDDVGVAGDEARLGGRFRRRMVRPHELRQLGGVAVVLAEASSEMGDVLAAACANDGELRRPGRVPFVGDPAKELGRCGRFWHSVHDGEG